MQNQFTLDRDLEHLVFDTIEQAHLIEDAKSLEALFEPACRRLGFSHIGAFSVRDPSGRMAGQYLAGGTDRIWEDHYIQQGHFEHDAIVEQIPNTLDFMVWSDIRRQRAVNADAATIFNEATEFGLADGFVLPLHFLNGAVAATVLLAPQPLEPHPRARAATHILSAYFAMAARKLMALPPANQIALSRRQRECLQWVRAGKSDWEIGEILSISEHTVAEHIEAARRKLGVRTRTQAVIEAITRKLISL